MEKIDLRSGSFCKTSHHLTDYYHMKQCIYSHAYVLMNHVSGRKLEIEDCGQEESVLADHLTYLINLFFRGIVFGFLWISELKFL